MSLHLTHLSDEVLLMIINKLYLSEQRILKACCIALHDLVDSSDYCTRLFISDRDLGCFQDGFRNKLDAAHKEVKAWSEAKQQKVKRFVVTLRAGLDKPGLPRSRDSNVTRSVRELILRLFSLIAIFKRLDALILDFAGWHWEIIPWDQVMDYLCTITGAADCLRKVILQNYSHWKNDFRFSHITWVGRAPHLERLALGRLFHLSLKGIPHSVRECNKSKTIRVLHLSTCLNEIEDHSGGVDNTPDEESEEEGGEDSTESLKFFDLFPAVRAVFWTLDASFCELRTTRTAGVPAMMQEQLASLPSTLESLTVTMVRSLMTLPAEDEPSGCAIDLARLRQLQSLEIFLGFPCKDNEFDGTMAHRLPTSLRRLDVIGCDGITKSIYNGLTQWSKGSKAVLMLCWVDETVKSKDLERIRSNANF